MATRWTAYSQALLQKNFPEFRRTVVFDSGKWDALYFVPYCSNSDTQYTILVDEDCFVFDRAQVLRDFPESGARYWASRRHVRTLLYGHYRIAYLVREDGDVEILGVFHGALDIDKYAL